MSLFCERDGTYCLGILTVHGLLQIGDAAVEVPYFPLDVLDPEIIYISKLHRLQLYMPATL